MNINSHKNIYFLGIGGISMSALALILKKRGFGVAGYDATRGSEVINLENAGIPVCTDISDIDFSGFDGIVFTAALHEDHPAMQKAISSGLPIYSRASLLGAIAGEYRHSVGVAGTHGKSTTSGMLARIYEEDGDSTYIVGAVMPFIGSAYKLGSDDRIAFEACEYMDSFLMFNPSLAVVLNVKLDHTDYFKDENAIISSFHKYISGSGSALINADDKNSVIAAENTGVKIYTFSVNGKADFTAIYENIGRGSPEFDILENGTKTAHVCLSIPGAHNVYNALAAYAAARLTGVSPENAIKGLEAFHGVNRRFEEFEVKACGGRFFSDYAHHPDELSATLEAARSITKGKLIAVFQPHTFSRLKSFFDEFASSLTKADEVIVTDVYAAREIDDKTVSGKLLANAVNGAEYISSFEDIANALVTRATENDTILLLGAGDITKLADILKRK